MTRLNEFQAQRVETTFAHIDKLLEAAESLARGKASPFAAERKDVSPEEQRFLTAFVQQMRTRMIAALDRLAIARPKVTLSARHSADVTLRFAELALADLSVKTLRGYGPVDPEAGDEVAALAADLRALLERGRALFHEADSGALAERLAELPGPFGEALRALERFSTEHALADVRPLINEAASRLAAQTFDVGVFGRVSAGKSSLINALLGTDVLPVGATPVTAVPLRLHHGPLGAIVDFEDGSERAITIEQIAEYGTEDRNPGNRAGVHSIEIGIPTVPQGLRFLDTPGIGSLSASAPAQAFAWLPRCDLGLILIAAGTAVGSDDLALISGFANAGIDCEILVSKADLLSADEVARTVAYVQREITALIGNDRPITVHAVSVLPSGALSLADFRATVLEPLIASHVHALHNALRARMHRLVAITRAALADSARLSTGAAEPAANDAGGDADVRQAAQSAMLQFRIGRESAHRRIRTLTDELSDSSHAVLEAAARALAEAWSEHAPDADAKGAARTAILRAAGDALSAVRKAVDDARPPNAVTNTAASPDAERVISAVADRRLPPVFDAPFLNQLPDLAAPRLLAAPRHVLAERRLAPIATALAADLGKYAARLYEWGEQALKELPEPAAASTDATRGAAPVQPVPDTDALNHIDKLIDEDETPS